MNENYNKYFDNVIYHLKEKKIRITETRKAIIKYIIESKVHPSAEKIYTDLLVSYPGISLATIYNNLKLLIEEGFVAEIKIKQNSTSYFDFIRHQHIHVICEKCGDITDFEEQEIPNFKKEIENKTHYKVTNIQMVVYGMCENCRSKNNK